MGEEKSYTEEPEEKLKDIFAGGPPKYHERLEEQNKLFVRVRL